ncbi:SpoIIE family protein phosphatase [Frankia sp. CNm7]|uniref:SpoIIE family protein phosphatase n=1 Tax=Frankia nepalensis TaxID=1836974 RepID=A0A937RNH8_9ACTN|nr:GAF domain-containing SpoIIE family protein phosphatase [Frankia nepalensis]MBL7502283.1 SpoIIE family protein phosphatase [Frankia nepalensis]MBL7514973.1 SpoIIE family protein phosphatase [Frankia nepalensis]MBL7522255.1 SpoIIE family protein phosphatase [Frankia nepalensis]MBL7629096.1 SpoIIE family protein phosphatase [Frankia nepalensis]
MDPRSGSASSDRVGAADRLAAVRATGPLDTDPEEPFDRLTRLAATILDVPLAFATMINGTRCYWKSVAGVPEKAPPVRQTPLDGSIFRQMINTGQPVVTPDATRETPILGDVLVHAAGLVAWAAFPVHGPDGHIVGAFGAADARPRPWTPRDLALLHTLAQAVSGEISLRHAAATATALARTLQESLLPPDIPELPGLRVSARYRPAGEGAEVLGDFYDVFSTGRTSLGVVLGDVAGKGVEAAKITALAHYTIRAAASRTHDPAAILNQLNTALLTQHPDSERFLSAAYLAVQESRRGRTVVVCSAGHTPVLLRRRDRTVTEVGAHGLVLGVFENPELTTTRLRLRPGDTLLLYTDGVTEARRGRDQFGDERLRALLASIDTATASTATADTVTAAVEAAVLAHTGGPPQDDIAILAIHLPQRT